MQQKVTALPALGATLPVGVPPDAGQAPSVKVLGVQVE